MKKILVTLLPAMLLAMGCQTSATVNKNLSIKGAFTEIEASLGVTVIYTPAPTVSVSVTAVSQEIYDRLEVERNGSKLYVGVRSEDGFFKGNNSVKKGEVTVRVSAPSVTSFNAEVGAVIEIAAPLTTGYDYEFDSSTGARITASAITASELDVSVSTGATVELGGISAVSVEAESSTGGSVRLAGKADSVNFDASTGASIDAASLSAKKGKADCSTAGSVTCNVDSLEADSSLGGKVKNNAR